tara:strand:- start:10098 stop:11807 length:1710 start_codon:yes stop_codon:yes gene_type:complete
MNSSKLTFFYSFFLLIISLLVGLNSTDFFTGEQYGYWYFNKIFINNFLYPDISRSPIYIIYLSLFNWLSTPFNFYAEAIVSNFLLSISLFFLFKRDYNNFYIFLIIAMSVGFFFNLIPYPQALALSLLNFAILLRKQNKTLLFLLSYLLIILAIYCRITYMIVFILFIFFDLLKELLKYKNTSKFDYKKNSAIFLTILFFFLTNNIFNSNKSQSKFNNGYFQSLEWKPSKSKSNIDIAFQVNFNFLYYEKNKNKILENKKDFFFVNKIAFDGADTLFESLKSNPKFVIWGIIKNSSHLAPIILNKFSSRNYLPSCSGIGHSCYSNYFYISFVFILFVLFNYYFFFKKKYENDFDIKCYSLINYALVFSTILAMPKIRYMTPFIFFLVPFNMYLISMFTNKLKNKNIKIILSLFIIFSFSYNNYTSKYLIDYFSIKKTQNNINSIKNYHHDFLKLNSKIANCNSLLTSDPTLFLANNKIDEDSVYSLADLPPFGKYTDDQGLKIYKNISINCLLLNTDMQSVGGANRGTGTDFEIRRKNYLFPFLKSNKKNIVDKINYRFFGDLYVFSEK